MMRYVGLTITGAAVVPLAVSAMREYRWVPYVAPADALVAWVWMTVVGVAVIWIREKNKR